MGWCSGWFDGEMCLQVAAQVGGAADGDVCALCLINLEGVNVVVTGMESASKATPDSASASNAVGKADINLAGRIDNLVLSLRPSASWSAVDRSE